MDKEQVIASIKQRILDEQRKHKTLDWAEIAARKIYSTHLVKEICNLPVVSQQRELLFAYEKSFESENFSDADIYQTIDNFLSK